MWCRFVARREVFRGGAGREVEAGKVKEKVFFFVAALGGLEMEIVLRRERDDGDGWKVDKGVCLYI